MERFKTCSFNDDYLIGDNGTVRSLIQRTIDRSYDKLGTLKGLVKPEGYKMYWLNKKWYYAHQLVAMHYCRNPHNWKEVNHIDGIKGNNHYKNLEWSTRKLNLMHMVHVLGVKMPKGKDHWMFNKPVSNETRAKMSVKKIGINHPKFKGYYIYNDLKCASLIELKEQLNTYRSTAALSKYCHNNMYGYSFEAV